MFFSCEEADFEPKEEKANEKSENNSNSNDLKKSTFELNNKEIDAEISFQKLSALTEPEIFFNTESCDKYLNYLESESYNLQNRKIFAELALKYSFENFLIKNLSFSLEYNIKIISAPISSFKNSKKIKSIAKILLSLTNQSIKFGNRVHEINGVQHLIDILTNENLTGILSKKIECKSSIFKSFEQFSKYIIGSLHNLAKISTKYMDLWRNADAVNRLIDFSYKIKSLKKLKNTCYVTIALLADDEEIENMTEIQEVVEFLTKTIIKCALQYDDPEKIMRTEIQLDDDIVYHKIISVSADGILWCLTELIQALYSLAINDSIKQDIYFKNRINDAIKKIIFNGNEKEVEISLKLLWQLCFDRKISADVESSNDLVEKIKSFIGSLNMGINQSVDGLMWLIKHNRIKQDSNSIIKDEFYWNSNEKEKNITEKSVVKHLMISYNRDSRDLCLKIKKDLEKAGQKVWIDVESIHGSSLEAMAKAIEDSKCVLMCMTEKYKQSSNCRAEAEYAFQLNKPIIPLIMQQNYKPDGWLGIILGSKIFVNFTKYDYNECVEKIFHEIKNLFNDESNEKILVKKNTDESEKLSTKNKNILDWSHYNIEIWFDDKNLNKTILKDLEPLNGKVLFQLHSILKTAPQFFYQSISTKQTINLRDIALFSYELTELFK